MGTPQQFFVPPIYRWVFCEEEEAPGYILTRVYNFVKVLRAKALKRYTSTKSQKAQTRFVIVPPKKSELEKNGTRMTRGAICHQLKEP